MFSIIFWIVIFPAVTAFILGFLANIFKTGAAKVGLPSEEPELVSLDSVNS